MFTAWSIKLLEVHIIPIECHIVCFSSSATGMFYFPVHCKCLTAIRLDLPEKNNLSRIIYHFYFHENFFFSTPKLSRDVPSSEIWRVCAAASRGGCKSRRSQKQSNTERDHFVSYCTDPGFFTCSEFLNAQTGRSLQTIPAHSRKWCDWLAVTCKFNVSGNSVFDFCEVLR